MDYIKSLAMQATHTRNLRVLNRMKHFEITLSTVQATYCGISIYFCITVPAIFKFTVMQKFYNQNPKIYTII